MCQNVLEVLHSVRCFSDNTCLMYPEPPNSMHHAIEELELVHGRLADVRASMKGMVLDEKFSEISLFVYELQGIVDGIHAHVMTSTEHDYEEKAIVPGRKRFKECYNYFLKDVIKSMDRCGKKTKIAHELLEIE